MCLEENGRLSKVMRKKMTIEARGTLRAKQAGESGAVPIGHPHGDKCISNPTSRHTENISSWWTAHLNEKRKTIKLCPDLYQ